MSGDAMDASQRPASPHSSGEYQVVGNKRSLPPSPPPKRSSSVESGAISALSSGRALTIHKKAHTAAAQPQRSANDDVDQKSVVNLASVPNASAAAVQRNDLRQAVLPAQAKSANSLYCASAEANAKSSDTYHVAYDVKQAGKVPSAAGNSFSVAISLRSSPLAAAPSSAAAAPNGRCAKFEQLAQPFTRYLEQLVAAQRAFANFLSSLVGSNELRSNPSAVICVNAKPVKVSVAMMANNSRAALDAVLNAGAIAPKNNSNAVADESDNIFIDDMEMSEFVGAAEEEKEVAAANFKNQPRTFLTTRLQGNPQTRMADARERPLIVTVTYGDAKIAGAVFEQIKKSAASLLDAEVRVAMAPQCSWFQARFSLSESETQATAIDLLNAAGIPRACIIPMQGAVTDKFYSHGQSWAYQPAYKIAAGYEHHLLHEMLLLRNVQLSSWPLRCCEGCGREVRARKCRTCASAASVVSAETIIAAELKQLVAAATRYGPSAEQQAMLKNLPCLHCNKSHHTAHCNAHRRLFRPIRQVQPFVSRVEADKNIVQPASEERKNQHQRVPLSANGVRGARSYANVISGGLVPPPSSVVSPSAAAAAAPFAEMVALQLANAALASKVDALLARLQVQEEKTASFHAQMVSMNETMTRTATILAAILNRLNMVSPSEPQVVHVNHVQLASSVSAAVSAMAAPQLSEPMQQSAVAKRPKSSRTSKAQQTIHAEKTINHFFTSQVASNPTTTAAAAISAAASSALGTQRSADRDARTLLNLDQGMSDDENMTGNSDMDEEDEEKKETTPRSGTQVGDSLRARQNKAAKE